MRPLLLACLVLSLACRRDETRPAPPVATPAEAAAAQLAPVVESAPRVAPAPVAPPGPSAAAPSVGTVDAAATADATATRPAPPASARPSAACGRAPGGSVRGVSHTTEGRTFHVWAPASYDGKAPLPVVLVFHGWYTNGRAFQGWFKMEDHVDGRALVVYPDAAGPMWSLRDDTDLAFVGRTLDTLAASYCIDRSRVLAFGFSFGGKFVHKLGCARPDLVRAIAVGDGSLGTSLASCGHPPVLVTHRTRDDDERFAWGKSAAEAWAGVNGCSATTSPSELGHGCLSFSGCPRGAPVTFCEDSHFDPTWPHDWNHTVREEYRALTFRWFASLP